MKEKYGMAQYRVETRRERAERLLLPLACKVAGHPPEQKMYAVICRRCRIVLEQR